MRPSRTKFKPAALLPYTMKTAYLMVVALVKLALAVETEPAADKLVEEPFFSKTFQNLRDSSAAMSQSVQTCDDYKE
jgi:hypothetical protein